MPARRLTADELRARGRSRSEIRARAVADRAAAEQPEVEVHGEAAIRWARPRVLPSEGWPGLAFHVDAAGHEQPVRDEAHALELLAASGGREPRVRHRWRPWGESMRPHVHAVAADARAAGYRGTRLREQDRHAIEALYGQRFTDPELRGCRGFWFYAQEAAAKASPRGAAIRAGWRRRRRAYGPAAAPPPAAPHVADGTPAPVPSPSPES